MAYRTPTLHLAQRLVRPPLLHPTQAQTLRPAALLPYASPAACFEAPLAGGHAVVKACCMAHRSVSLPPLCQGPTLGPAAPLPPALQPTCRRGPHQGRRPDSACHRCQVTSPRSYSTPEEALRPAYPRGPSHGTRHLPVASIARGSRGACLQRHLRRAAYAPLPSCLRPGGDTGRGRAEVGVCRLSLRCWYLGLGLLLRGDVDLAYCDY